ncbi:hypothetical protein GGD56_003945 [Rhizobium mongolense]|uniref:Uncharacterized protein n=2 Tax=Rhizobium mongolense TaxID=57676 RepID=A0ABR6IQC3_9HYPH|nr:hypothetical protein [Rhizobium mongolense]TVZ72776.1 hypothetical protein BCL32_0962 [Rhizobium mongolense USDA 1844]
MSIIDLGSCYCSLESDKTRGTVSKNDTFHAFWRGDDLVDLSGINMQPNRIKVRDGAKTANIKIL